jgi:hypothetical protein
MESLQDKIIKMIITELKEASRENFIGLDIDLTKEEWFYLARACLVLLQWSHDADPQSYWET